MAWPSRKEGHVSQALDFSLDLVWLLACVTVGLVLLLILSLLLLRWVRWRREPQLQAFQARWRRLLMRCALGDDVQCELPTLRPGERWSFMKLWLHCQMSLHGPARDRLARLAQTLDCGPMALSRLSSRYAAERLMAILALGFLKDASAQPAVLEQMRSGSSQTALYAARAVLEINARAHADEVVQTLLQRHNLDLSLVSVLLKPFRGQLQQALLSQAPAASFSDDHVLPWLKLARALMLQLPSRMLSPFLTDQHSTDVLIAAIRLFQGESGSSLVSAHAQHEDWRVRTQVAQALGQIGTPHDVDVLVHMTTDPQWWVRYRAAQALLRIPGLAPQRVHSLIATTQDRYAANMLAAVMAEEGRAA